MGGNKHMKTKNNTGMPEPGISNLLLVLVVLLMLCGSYTAGAMAQEIGPDFDHDNTRFPLDFKHALVRCEACHVRPATVRVTEVESGSHRTVHLCDSCARERGDALL